MGFISLIGATWREYLVLNMNSGFWPRAPRNLKVNEGKEKKRKMWILAEGGVEGVGRLATRAVSLPEGCGEGCEGRIA